MEDVREPKHYLLLLKLEILIWRDYCNERINVLRGIKCYKTIYLDGKHTKNHRRASGKPNVTLQVEDGEDHTKKSRRPNFSRPTTCT